MTSINTDPIGNCSLWTLGDSLHGFTHYQIFIIMIYLLYTNWQTTVLFLYIDDMTCVNSHRDFQTHPIYWKYGFDPSNWLHALYSYSVQCRTECRMNGKCYRNNTLGFGLEYLQLYDIHLKSLRNRSQFMLVVNCF